MLIANLKMNGSFTILYNILSTCQEMMGTKQSEVVLAVPAVYLFAAQNYITLNKLNIKLAAQDVSIYSKHGAFTGELSATMLYEVGARYVLIGHSERRQYAGESVDSLSKKLHNSLYAGLTPIYCIGEQDITTRQEVLSEQLSELTTSLGKCSLEHNQHIVLAYEPCWAIGTGIPLDCAAITESLAFIRDKLKSDKLNYLLLYGGSVSAQHATDIWQINILDGLLIGKASLDMEQLKQIYSKQNFKGEF